MEPELLKRAQKVAELVNSSKITAADIREVNEVYFLLTGKEFDCKRCEVYRLITAIDRTINPKPKFIAMGKYQFIKPGTMIVRNTGTGFRQITDENLNKGDNAEYVLKKNAHLIQDNPAFEAAQKTEPTSPAPAPAPVQKHGKKGRKK